MANYLIFICGLGWGAEVQNFFPKAKRLAFFTLKYRFKIMQNSLRSFVDLYSSPTIIRIIKSRRMRWAGQVARMGEKRKLIDSWWQSQKERDH
jgi:hypothetical protein